MRKILFILELLILLAVVSCNEVSRKEHIVDNGNVVLDSKETQYDWDLQSALQSLGKDSLEKKKLWSRFSKIEIYPNNYLKTISGLTKDITVRQSNDSIYIQHCQSLADEHGNIAHEGYCYNVVISDKKYRFIDNRWSDLLHTDRRENKIEYSPFYLNKPKYKIGDTLIGCVTIKDSQFDDKKLTQTKFLKFAINAIVTK